jgi:hypothetical protein
LAYPNMCGRNIIFQTLLPLDVRKVRWALAAMHAWKQRLWPLSSGKRKYPWHVQIRFPIFCCLVGTNKNHLTEASHWMCQTLWVTGHPFWWFSNLERDPLKAMERPSLIGQSHPWSHCRWRGGSLVIKGWWWR